MVDLNIKENGKPSLISCCSFWFRLLVGEWDGCEHGLLGVFWEWLGICVFDFAVEVGVRALTLIHLSFYFLHQGVCPLQHIFIRLIQSQGTYKILTCLRREITSVRCLGCLFQIVDPTINTASSLLQVPWRWILRFLQIHYQWPFTSDHILRLIVVWLRLFLRSPLIINHCTWLFRFFNWLWAVDMLSQNARLLGCW
jgi:hypothetical protein